MFLSITTTWRELRKVIVSLLKSKVVTKVLKWNYVQEYSLKENKIQKNQKKILFVETDQKEKCLEMIKKQIEEVEELSSIR